MRTTPLTDDNTPETAVTWEKSTMYFDEWLHAAELCSGILRGSTRVELVGSHLNASSLVWFQGWLAKMRMEGGCVTWDTFATAFEEEHSQPRSFFTALKIIQETPHITAKESAAEYLWRVEKELLMIPWKTYDQDTLFIPQSLEEHIVIEVRKGLEWGHPVRAARGTTTWQQLKDEVRRVTARSKVPGDRTIEQRKMGIPAKEKPVEPMRDMPLGNRVIPAAQWSAFLQDATRETVRQVVEDEGIDAVIKMVDQWQLMTMLHCPQEKIEASMAKMARDFSLQQDLTSGGVDTPHTPQKYPSEPAGQATPSKQCTTLIAGGAFMYKKHALVFEVRNHGRWSTVVTTLVPIVGEQRKKGTLTNASHITVEAEISSKIRDPVVWAFGKTARYTRENINRQWTEGGMTVCIEIWDTICMDVA
ncbi:hypothetical protein BGZ73_007558 [Actinomortierella ambigua]|nr:hypothetical protein BGZ73_007558 [Actinomortierella ambigua]